MVRLHPRVRSWMQEHGWSDGAEDVCARSAYFYGFTREQVLALRFTAIGNCHWVETPEGMILGTRWEDLHSVSSHQYRIDKTNKELAEKEAENQKIRERMRKELDEEEFLRRDAVVAKILTFWEETRGCLVGILESGTPPCSRILEIPTLERELRPDWKKLAIEALFFIATNPNRFHLLKTDGKPPWEPEESPTEIQMLLAPVAKALGVESEFAKACSSFVPA